jgi:hypothetical protein
MYYGLREIKNSMKYPQNLIECNYFSPRYNWQIAHLTLDNIHSFTLFLSHFNVVISYNRRWYGLLDIFMFEIYCFVKKITD